MLILLPPSQGKASRTRGRPMDWDALVFPELTQARLQVAEALRRASERDDALTVLKVGARVADEVAGNTRLHEAPALRARELFTGVLYDALGLASLSPGDSRRANSRLLVASALHGLVRPTDRISPFRLSMEVDLPGVGPLARHWAGALAPAMAEGAPAGVIVDCRSTSYRAAWRPSGEQAERWVVVDVPGASHWAKHTRGLVARRLCQVPAPRRVADLPTALGEGFRTELVMPARPGQPWTALVCAHGTG